MEILVSGHQVDTGEALRQHVQDRMSAIADKYFSRAISTQVTFGKAPFGHFSCDIIAHVMQGVILKGHGRASEAHPAFDQAADRIEKQLRRYMRRLKDKHGTGRGLNGAAVYEAEAGYTVFESGDEENEPSDNPPVVAETRVDIPEASVSDAVMQLDLRNTNALLFRNSGTGNLNMVYRRGDGTIGWVEPERG